MALDKYQVFLKVAENGNLTRAAAELNYTQSAISHIIKNLEEEVGMQLLIRGKNGIHLTAEGKVLLEEARQIVKQENAFYQKASMLRGLEIGTINVGAFSSVSMQWMPHILQSMYLNYPGITVIQFHDNYSGIERLLETGQIDCGFLSDQYHGNFHFIPLVEDEYFVILPKGHPLCRFERIPVEALNGEKMILMNEGGTDYNTGTILKKVSYTVTHWVNEDFVLIPLVERGLGISILPKLILDCTDTTVVQKRFAVPRYRTIGLAVKNPDEMSALTELFISLVKEYVGRISVAENFEE